MIIVEVNISVKPECVEEFKAAALENARNSALEPGVVRFEVLQKEEEPTRFQLVEIYRTPADQAKHRETPHYLKWKETVPALLTEPYTVTKLRRLYPEPD